MDKKKFEERTILDGRCDVAVCNEDYFENPIDVYFYKQRQHDILSLEEIIQLIDRFKKDNDKHARDLIIKHNMRLLFHTAKSFHWSRLSIHDLMQEGVFGLIKAVERFDASKGVRFSVFATECVRQAMQFMILNYNSLVYLPYHAFRLRWKILRSVEFLSNNYYHSPTIEEIAEHAQESVNVVIKSLFMHDVSDVSLDGIGVKKSYSEEKVLYDFIPDINLVRPDTFFETKEFMEELVYQVERVFSFVEKISTPRNFIIFKKRYKFRAYSSSCKNDKPFRMESLEKIAKEFDLTFTRVRHILREIWRRIEQTSMKIDEKHFLDCFYTINDLEKIISVNSGVFEA
ncbi:MAG: sigma-70 family RNA polymerase sigma factor [Patescibacteria group bacterium]